MDAMPGTDRKGCGAVASLRNLGISESRSQDRLNPIARRLLNFQGQEHYSSYTVSYFWWKKRARVVEVFREFLEKRGSDRLKILDLGCGDGYDLVLMAREAGDREVSFTGLDLNAENVDYVRTRAVYEGLVGIEVLKGRIQDLASAFQPCAFDFVLCSEVLEHLEEPEEALGQIARLLTEGGWAVITTPNADNMISRLARRMGRGGPRRNVQQFREDEHEAQTLGHGHISEKNHREWRQLFDRRGFRILKTHREAILYGYSWLDRRPILAGLIIAFDGLMDILLPSPQLASGNVYVLEKRPSPHPEPLP